MFKIKKMSSCINGRKCIKGNRINVTSTKLLVLMTFFLAISLQKQLFAAETTLSNTSVIIGATAEVGSTDKEGLFDWKSAKAVQKTIQSEFGLVQTTAYPAWGVWTGTAQNPKIYDLSNTNKIINWANENNKKVAIHLLCGSGTYFPSWFNSGTWTNAQLEDLMSSWITEIITTNNNASKVNYWNVVNEPFTWDGKYWSKETECRWQQLGWETDQSGLTGNAKVYDQHPVYIRKAFEIARSKTSAKLELRDYYIEFWDGSVKARAFYQLVKHLINSGVPIDAVGFQGHFRLDRSYDWSKLTQAVMEYKKLGLEVYITEVDYGDTDHIAAAKTPQWSAQMDSIQKKAFYDFTKAAVTGGVDWICLWGVADNTNSYWRMGQNALLFDEQYLPKPAYNGFYQGILDGLSTKTVNFKSPALRSQFDLRITGSNINLNGIDISKYNLFDVSGKLLESSEPFNNKINISHVSKGVYFLQIFSNTSAPVFVNFIR